MLRSAMAETSNYMAALSIVKAHAAPIGYSSRSEEPRKEHARQDYVGLPLE